MLHDDAATLVQDVDDDGRWEQERYIAMAYRQFQAGGLDLLSGPNWLAQAIGCCDYIKGEIEAEQMRRVNG